MANVNVRFNNKDYLLSCDDGQEEDLKNLTKFLDKKYTDLKAKLGNLGENKLLLITAIQVIDEYFDLKKRVLSQKTNFDDLSSKSRTKDITRARQIAMYLSREVTNISLLKIGDNFGNRDHTTVMHAIDKIKQLISSDEDIKSIVDNLIKQIQKAST